mgnify:CR=1 FL=1
MKKEVNGKEGEDRMERWNVKKKEGNRKRKRGKEGYKGGIRR